MSEVTPTMENLTDPYVLQLIEALAKQDDEIGRLTTSLKASRLCHRTANEELHYERQRVADLQARVEALEAALVDHYCLELERGMDCPICAALKEDRDED
jgi:hypothetical protein